MDFEARKLRVQFPCGDITLVACVWWSCRLPSRFTCLWWSPPYCPPWRSACTGDLWTFVERCPIGTITPTQCPLGSFDPRTCPGPSGDPPPPIQLDPEDLDILREQLQGQLQLVTEAQEKIQGQLKQMKK